MKAKDGIQGAGSSCLEFLDDITATPVKDAHLGKRWYSGPKGSKTSKHTATTTPSTAVRGTGQSSRSTGEEWVAVNRTAVQLATTGVVKRPGVNTQTATKRTGKLVARRAAPPLFPPGIEYLDPSVPSDRFAHPVVFYKARPILKPAPDNDIVPQRPPDQNVRFDLPKRIPQYSRAGQRSRAKPTARAGHPKSS